MESSKEKKNEPGWASFSLPFAWWKMRFCFAQWDI
jgi:hypothetical protein